MLLNIMQGRKGSFCIVVISIYFLIGCSKIVDVNPPVTNLTTASAFADDNTAIAVMTGHYANLSNVSSAFSNAVSRFASLSADDLTLWNGVSNTTQLAYYRNELFSNAGGSIGAEYWPYPNIFTCNVVIEEVEKSSTLSNGTKKQLIGEAKFMRAWYFFHLVNFYGDIPMPVSTDFQINARLYRSPKADVYRQITTDLIEAEELLSSEYLDGGLKPYVSNIERVRPTKWAAASLLSRVYLYNGEFDKAEAEATKVIDNTALFGLVAISDVFKKNSKETIWQLQDVSAGGFTSEGSFFFLTSAGPNAANPAYLSADFLNSFEQGDKRGTVKNWIDSIKIGSISYFFPAKYKSRTGVNLYSEYLMMLRVGEQFLIRAEARAHQNNLAGSLSDINAIRTRARETPSMLIPNPLPNISGPLTQQQILDTILHERRTELFTEWAHRWFDIKRTGKVDAIMIVASTRKGGNWNPTDKLYPILFADILRNVNLTQNPGY